MGTDKETEVEIGEPANARGYYPGSTFKEDETSTFLLGFNSSKNWFEFERKADRIAKEKKVSRKPSIFRYRGEQR